LKIDQGPGGIQQYKLQGHLGDGHKPLSQLGKFFLLPRRKLSPNLTVEWVIRGERIKANQKPFVTQLLSRKSHRANPARSGYKLHSIATRLFNRSLKINRQPSPLSW